LKKTIFNLILAIGWLIISIFLLTIPGSSFPKENWLDKLWVDKWVHIAMFAIMVWLWCRAIPAAQYSASRLRNIFLGIAIASFAFGIGMEFVQRYLVVNRSFDIGDIVADGLGALAGLIFSRRQYIKK
jgi:hypothetical protein